MPISASFGTIEYREDSEIVVPITFEADIFYVNKTAFKMERITGEEVWEVIEDYALLNSNDARTFYLHFQMQLNKKGSFKISAIGDVYKTYSSREVVQITPINVAYNTAVPQVVKAVVDPLIPGERLTLRYAFNVPVTGWHLNNTVPEIFYEAGFHPGQPTPFKWVGTGVPDLDAEVPDPIPSEWQKLASPPGGTTPGMNGFNKDGTQWHGESAQFFLIVYDKIPLEIHQEFVLVGPSDVLRGPTA